MSQLKLNCGSISDSNYLDQSAIERNNNSSDSNLITAIIKFRKLQNKNNETQPPKLVTDDPNHLVANNKSYEICGIEYVCHGCNKLFISAGKYNEHVLVSHENRKYLRPDGFNEESNKKFNLKRKISLEEKQIYKHPCPHCTHTSKTMSALKIHLASHSDIRPHQCPHCNRACKTKFNLSRHLRLHSSYRPHKCPYCPFDSTRSDQLKRHVRSHMDEKSYECDVCKKKIKRLHNLKSHKTTHRANLFANQAHECSICAKQFSDRSSLKLHKKIHRKGNRYYCTECSYSVSNVSTLRNHFKKKAHWKT
ncbi:zinc finger protein 182-like [Microplitis mediator]|uniref:zinc finger protein 182-like n=1 Tax=Microplitis mediator TaxID=375433 RepID=UPI0025521580|nr:zinc finger protein 182-like [Microplitis mediator]